MRFVHYTTDGPIQVESIQTDGGWIATLWRWELDGGGPGPFKTVRKANEFRQGSFAEMFPERH